MTATPTRTSPTAATRRGRQSRGQPQWQRRLTTLWHDPWNEALLVVALFIVAAAVRWPYLLRLPHFTDETVEMLWAYSIYQGDRLPLTASDAYYGPLHAYIVAACFWLFGPSIVLPRAIVLVFGALTVVATYFLGREIAGRGVGLLGAALVATAPQHIIVNSHVAWQNSTTPFYSTVCCWALVRAFRLANAAPPADGWGRAGPYLVLSGFFYGLTLQTHPGTIVLAPGLVATTLYGFHAGRHWPLLRRPWPYATVLAGLAAYSPILIYNLTHDLAGVIRVQTRRNYAFEMDPSWESYRQNVVNLLLELARIVSNPMRLPEQRLHYLTSPYLVIAVTLCLLGIGVLVRRRQPLPFFALLSTTLIMPRFNHAYGVEGDRYLLTGRYVTFLLPLATVAIACAVLALSAAVLRAVPRRWRDAAIVLPAVLTVLLVLYPLQPLARYYTHESAQDPDNATFLATVRFINEVRGPRTPILIDDFLNKVDLKDGADAREILSYLLTLDGVPHRVVKNPRDELRRLAAEADPNDPQTLPIIVMMRDGCWPLRGQAPLQRISDRLLLRELYWTLPSYYAVYRYAPPPQPADCLPASGPSPGD